MNLLIDYPNLFELTRRCATYDDPTDPTPRDRIAAILDTDPDLLVDAILEALEAMGRVDE